LRRATAALAVAALLTAAVATFLASAAHGLSPAPRSAIERAQAFIRTKTDTRLARNQTFSFRSARDRRWALVDGLLADERLWAVWVRHNGRRWVIKSGGVGRARARAHGVPCDIVVAFSEPAC
jgi:hypothetical protein